MLHWPGWEEIVSDGGFTQAFVFTLHHPSIFTDGVGSCCQELIDMCARTTRTLFDSLREEPERRKIVFLLTGSRHHMGMNQEHDWLR